MKKWPTVMASLVVLIAILSGNLVVAATSDSGADLVYEVAPLSDGETAIVRAYFPNLDVAHKVVRSFNALESVYETGYLILEVTQEEIGVLTDLGFEIQEIAGYDPHHARSAIQALADDPTIPGYPCYRTVEGTFAFAERMVDEHPNLASWIDVGNSWEKTQGLGGYDMMVLILTNSAISGPKPKFMATCAIHAREYSTAPLCVRFAEQLLTNYGTDADATWILDYHEVHLMLHANPDGRKQAESGKSWRKNTNQNYCGATSDNRGADLNRNFPFKWNCCGGSSGDPCESTYRGPSPASEPETQTVRDYLRSIFPDQRGPNDTDAAPDDATGVYIDFHSHGRLVLWPWGFTSTTAPNGTQLQTLGRKFAYWNSHSPEQAVGLYPADGCTDDFGYGDLGVAAYTFELGTSFFQSCSYFEDTIVPDNLPTMLYAAKAARTPFMTPAGPDAYNLSLSQDDVPAGTSVTLDARVSDTRYNNSNGTEPTQNIAEAEYYIDTPPWVGGATAHSMASTDGSFNEKTEDVRATIDTTGWSTGQHIIFVRGKDVNNNWGAFGAIFVNISSSGPTPTPTNTPTNTPTPTQTPTEGPTSTPTNTPTDAPPKPILVVDDDAGKTYEGYYTAALDALGKEYDTWNVQSQGSPSLAELQERGVVIWFTGDDYQTTLTSTDQSNLGSYLDGGGKLFVSGQDLGYDIRGDAFYGNYLHASYVRDDTDEYDLTGTDILSGVNVNISGTGGANNQGYPSEIDTGSGAVGVFDYAGTYTWGGIRWEGAYKVVYFSFGFEAINTASARNSVMEAVLSWFEGGPPPTPSNTPTPPDTPTITPTPTPTEPGGDIFFDTFEGDQGWTVDPSGSDTATTGTWERADPEGTDYNGPKQLGTTVSGSYDLVTGPAAGSSVGSYDIDGGVTSIRSPNISLPADGDITLSFSYYLAHTNNASADDYLRVKVVGDTTAVVFEELGAADDDDAAWETFSGSLNAFAGQTIYLLIEAADGGGGSIVEAGIDDARIVGGETPPPPTHTPTPTNTPTTPPINTPTHTPTPTPTEPGGEVFSDDFETDKGWTVNPSGGDTATTGAWERANPEGTEYSGTAYQLNSTVSGSYDLVTGPLAGSSAGSYDIDGGVTTIRSPDITLPSSGDLTLSFSYYLSHYTNAASDDYLRVKVVDSTTTTVFEELGAGNTDAAAWDTFSTSLNDFAGQTIYLLIEAADGGSGSLVEAAIDNVSITSNR